MTDVKFCGLTRAADAAAAVELGARYVGVIFAGGPRMLTASSAAAVLADVPPSVRRVGVFSATESEHVAAIARNLSLGVVQLHSDPDSQDLDALRRIYAGELWAVLRTADATLPPQAARLFAEADAVVLDAKVAGALGGTGVRLPWTELARPIAAVRGRGSRRARLVLAGGLTPENVAEAIAVLDPDVVDVSSGVEATPGVKDHARMRAFAAAALADRPMSSLARRSASTVDRSNQG